MTMTSQQKSSVLIVDDEPDILELLSLTLSRMGVESRCAENVQQAQDLLRGNQFDLCLTDMRLPDGNGIELIRHMQEHYPTIPVAMITAHGNMDSAIEALKAGAFDFLSKPVELHLLRELITSALRLNEGERECPPQPGTLQLLGQSAYIEHIRKTIGKLARSQAPVYISGESGTGKELVARLIHLQGPRANAPFIAVNCGAIPADLMESELFGHKKGSFTGAYSDKDGLFQAANGGTLFLDEVADLPLEMQVKLLRAIQEKAVRPVGGQKELHTDVRILSATNKGLDNAVKDGTFREDLFYRLNVIELRVPPLRDRPEDIPLLVEHFTRQLAQEMGMAQPKLGKEAMKTLLVHPFPGNVRELENILERAMTLCEGNTIQSDDLRLTATNQATDKKDESIESIGLEAYLENIERRLIQTALGQNRQNKTAAAKALGISFRSLRYRMEKLRMS
jgi:two-component system, NtrC family, response regulator PilR